jgi:hypothetical protein
MGKYENQHYLPLVYLAQFGRPNRAPRRRLIWRVTEGFAREVPVGGQCQENYFYSKTNASICEGYFGQIEGRYGELMAKIAKGETLTADDLFRFFLCAVDFYARGCKFKARSAREEFELYLHRIAIFKSQLISADMASASDDVRRDFVLMNWDFGIVRFPEQAALLTSDSPAIWLGSSRGGNELRAVLLPLTPLGCFVGVNRHSYRIVSLQAEPGDAGVLNNNQMENCVNAVFCPQAGSSEEIAFIQSRIARRTALEPRSDAWAFELIDYDLNQNLSFLRTVSPA